MGKFCKKCGIEKNQDQFSAYNFLKNGGWCKSCVSEYAKNYHQNNKQERNKKSRERASSKKEETSIYYKNYSVKNKEKLKANSKVYYKNNKSRILERVKIYNFINKDSKKQYNIKFNLEHPKYQSEYKKLRKKNDPSFKLRSNVSRLIRLALNDKNNQSIMRFLPYSIQELKNHLENQFEFWMRWNNYGAYDKSNWDDNNSETWTWNIDHIIPQSKFPFSSMNDINFKKCWSLENLRPYSAKQNVLDGINRVRH